MCSTILHIFQVLYLETLCTMDSCTRWHTSCTHNKWNWGEKKERENTSDKTATLPTHPTAQQLFIGLMNSCQSCIILISKRGSFRLICDYIYLSYLQWTTIGLYPVCCCVLMTWSMRLTIPAPVLGAPLSGQAVKWNCFTTRCLLSVDYRVVWIHKIKQCACSSKLIARMVVITYPILDTCTCAC